MLLDQGYHAPHGSVKDEYGAMMEEDWQIKTS
jgi:hypothetical protein